MIRLTSLVLLVLFPAFPSAALEIRPDRDDAEYLELATRYASSVPVGTGMGALIAPRWLVTSPDVAKSLQGKVRVGSADHEIERVFQNEVALVLLRKPVSGIEPTRLYRDEDEKGRTVIFVGRGADGRKRAAINTVDRVEPKMLALGIKPLDEASDLQGALGAPDAGAPAYIDGKEGIFVAGIGQRHTPGADYFIRVSPLVAWIEAVMMDVATREAEALMDSDRR